MPPPLLLLLLLTGSEVVQLPQQSTNIHLQREQDCVSPSPRQPNAECVSPVPAWRARLQGRLHQGHLVQIVTPTLK